MIKSANVFTNIDYTQGKPVLAYMRTLNIKGQGKFKLPAGPTTKEHELRALYNGLEILVSHIEVTMHASPVHAAWQEEVILKHRDKQIFKTVLDYRESYSTHDLHLITTSEDEFEVFTKNGCHLTFVVQYTTI